MEGGAKMKDIEKVVSNNIKRLMNEKNINQRELANIAGVSESTVGKWVLEKATPRMGAIQKISDHYNIPKSYILEEENEYKVQTSYNFFPTEISAGLPFEVDGMTESKKISVPDEMLGKYKGDKSVFFTRVFGDSMNKVFDDGTIIGVKPIALDKLKNGDIVVFSNNYEYSVKYYYRYGDTLVFKPASHNPAHDEQVYTTNDDITIHGKVILHVTLH